MRVRGRFLSTNLPVCLIAAFVLLSQSVGIARAQEPITWGEPVNLSNSPRRSKHSAIVADGYGFVHVVWGENVGGRDMGADERPDRTNTIMYRRWDGSEWSQAVDIAFIEGDLLADYPSLAVDDRNQLHLVWTGLSGLYYSGAHATEAHSAQAWSKLQPFGPAGGRSRYETDIAVDGGGSVHIAYALRGDRAGIYHTSIPAGGAAMTAPSTVAQGLRPIEGGVRDVRLAVDQANRLHVVWSTTSTVGRSQAVYYARSEDSGVNWDEPVILADATIEPAFTGFPILLAYGEDDLLVLHVDQLNKGRIERLGKDAGRTWGEPRMVLTDMEGVNGFLTPLLDRDGTMHLVVNMRPRADQRTGVYYAPRAGLDWSPVSPIAIDEPSGPSAHYADATVRLGHQIHIPWTQHEGGEIWHISGTIDGVSQILAESTPQPSSAVPVATVHEEPATPFVTRDTSVASDDRPTSADTYPTNSRANSSWTWSAIVAAIVPVLLLIAGVVAWGVLASRRR